MHNSEDISYSSFLWQGEPLQFGSTLGGADGICKDLENMAVVALYFVSLDSFTVLTSASKV